MFDYLNILGSGRGDPRRKSSHRGECGPNSLSLWSVSPWPPRVPPSQVPGKGFKVIHVKIGER